LKQYQKCITILECILNFKINRNNFFIHYRLGLCYYYLYIENFNKNADYFNKNVIKLIGYEKIKNYKKRENIKQLSIDLDNNGIITNLSQKLEAEHKKKINKEKHENKFSFHNTDKNEKMQQKYNNIYKSGRNLCGNSTHSTLKKIILKNSFKLINNRSTNYNATVSNNFLMNKKINNNKSEFLNKAIKAFKRVIFISRLNEYNNYSENMKKAISQLFEVDQNNRIKIKNFLIQDYIVKITEKVGLLPELHELYPSEIKYEENDIINHIYKNILRRNDILSEELFNMNYNKQPYAWINKNEKISSYSLDYYPPIGWFGIGLNVNVNRYNDNNNWLNKKTGWATAYHGLRLLDTKDNKYHIKNCNKYDLNRKLELTIKSIIENGLKIGINQPFNIEPNNNSLSKNEYNLCGEGIYLSFRIEEAKQYTIPISGYIFVLMCKVCPTKIRESERFKGEFVVDENYVRPYRILAIKNDNKYN
jgi:hypothetical protein